MRASNAQGAQAGWLLAAAALLAGCAAPTSTGGSMACERAADITEECTGERPTPPEVCDGETAAQAERIAAGGCPALERTKADGSLTCSRWLRWLGMCREKSSGQENARYIDDLLAFAPTGTFHGEQYMGPSPFGDCVIDISHEEHTDGTSEFRVGLSWDGTGGHTETSHFALSTREHTSVSEAYTRLDEYIYVHAHYDSPDEHGSAHGSYLTWTTSVLHLQGGGEAEPAPSPRDERNPLFYIRAGDGEHSGTCRYRAD